MLFDFLRVAVTYQMSLVFLVCGSVGLIATLILLATNLVRRLDCLHFQYHLRWRRY